MEQVIPPTTDETKNPQFVGYRHPKEIAANLPPPQLQRGVYQPEGPMI
jgi:hypothetical protein